RERETPGNEAAELHVCWLFLTAAAPGPLPAAAVLPQRCSASGDENVNFSRALSGSWQPFWPHYEFRSHHSIIGRLASGRLRLLKHRSRFIPKRCDMGCGDRRLARTLIERPPNSASTSSYERLAR